MTLEDPVGITAAGRAIGFDKSNHPNCSSILFDNLDRNPDSLAVTGPAGELTYRELCNNASAWGHAFIAAGLGRADRIVFFLDDTPNFPAAFFGAVRAGFVPVLLNTQSSQDLVNYYIEDSGASIAVCEAEFSHLFENSTVTTLVVNNECATAADSTRKQLNTTGSISAAEFLEPYSVDLAVADTGPDDMAFWMYSSGSTGRPKGIVHLQHDMAYTVASYANHILQVKSSDRLFSAPKLFFAYGFGNGITFPFAAGACAVLMPGQPRADAVFRTIEKYRPTLLFGLPTLYSSLCKSDGAATRNLSSLRLCLSAAETLSEEVFHAWQNLTGLEPVEGLGSTEMLHIYLSNTTEDKRLGSAGRVVPGYEVKLIDPEGSPVETGNEGTMLVKGHSSAPCYWNRQEQTASTMRDDWLYTGDIFVEQEGAYYFQGRADDLVKISGQWVWPLEVERCLADHPSVHECAVLAHTLPDKRVTLRAVVKLIDNQQASDETTKALQDFVKGKLLPYKYPRIIQYLDVIPHTGTGKIDRQAIKNLQLEDP